MTKARLLQAVCTVAMLAAAPAFAQTDTQPADTGAHNTVNAPEAPSGGSAMAPASKMGSSSGGGSAASMSTHHHMAGAMHGRNDASQNAAVDQLNDRSYQAAQRGEAFDASNSSSAGGSMAPAESGHMNAMPGGSAPGASDAAGATSGATGK